MLKHSPVLLGLAFSSGCEQLTQPGLEPGTVAEVTAANSNFSTLAEALQAGGLTETLSGVGPYTLFAPANSAFEALPVGSVDALLATENRAVLSELLGFHVVQGKLESAQLRDGQKLKTLEGGSLAVTVRDGWVSVNGVPLVTPDLQATNGIIHSLGSVLTMGLDVMQFAAVTPELSTLTSLLNASEMNGALAGTTLVTLFAPVDKAFAKLDPTMTERLGTAANRALLQKVLAYHMLSGRVYAADMREDTHLVTVQGQPVHIAVNFGRRVNTANIVTTDIRVTNGVIHLIDTVLQENLDLLDIMSLRGFDAFVRAVATANDAGLTSALRWGTLTLFAPTNAAFDALGSAAPVDPAAMAKLLRYHIAQGRLGAGSLVDGQQVKTLHGGELRVQKGSGITLLGSTNGASVSVEIGAANGVIHGLDSVLAPPP